MQEQIKEGEVIWMDEPELICDNIVPFGNMNVKAVWKISRNIENVDIFLHESIWNIAPVRSFKECAMVLLMFFLVYFATSAVGEANGE